MAKKSVGGSQPAAVAPPENSVVDEVDLTGEVMDVLGPKFGVSPTPKPSAEQPVDEVPDTPEEVPADDPPAETPADEPPETPNDVDPNPDEDATRGLKPETKERIQKRMDELTARAKTAEERVQALESEQAALKQQLAQPQSHRQEIPEHPLVEARDLRAIEQHEMKLVQWIDQLQTAVDLAQDEGRTEIEDGEKSYRLADVRAQIRRFQGELNSVVPRARQIVAQRQQSEAKAREIFPEAFDQTKPEFQAVEAILRDDPFMRRHPNGRFVAALIVEGQKAVRARMQPAKPVGAKPQAPVKPAPRLPMTPSAGAPAARVTPEKQPKDWDVAGLVKAGGSREALVKMAGNLLG